MRRLLWDISLVAATRYACEALLLLRGFLLARILAPEGFGVWASMRLVILFSTLCSLGALHGLLQHAPQAAGSGDAGLAAAYRRAGAALPLAAGLAAALLLAALSAAGGAGSAWLLLAAVVFLTEALLVYRIALQAQQRFGWASASAFAAALLSTAGGAWAAARYGLPGFVAALALSYAIVLIVCSLAGPAFPRPAFDPPRTRRLVRTGFPILAAESASIALWNVDKLLLWLLADTALLGTYAVQAYVTAGVMMLPSAVFAVLRPHLAETLGRAGDRKAARPYLDVGCRLLARAAAPLLGALFFLFPLAVRHWLPEYAATIAPGRILLLATYFPLVAVPAAAVLVTTGAQGRLLLLRLAAVVASAGAIAAALLAGGGLQAVALGTAVGLALAGTLTLAAALRSVRHDAGRTFALALALPFVCLVAAAATGPAALLLTLLPWVRPLSAAPPAQEVVAS